MVIASHSNYITPVIWHLPHKVDDTVYRGRDAISRERVKSASHATIDVRNATIAFTRNNCSNSLNVIDDFVVLGNF